MKAFSFHDDDAFCLITICLSYMKMRSDMVTIIQQDCARELMFLEQLAIIVGVVKMR
jgi:hypothetical protein